MAEEARGNPGEYVTVEIYDQLYHLSGHNPDHIRELADYVDSKMRAADAQILAMHVESTPTVIVNGKYRVLRDSVKSNDEFIELIKYLVAREGGGGG